MLIVGFTGTREGMTQAQRRAVEDVVYRLWLHEPGSVRGDHGDCVGADAAFHAICEGLGVDTGVHPPEDPEHRAWCKGTVMFGPLPYHDRNHAIVDGCAVLVAAPKQTHGEVRPNRGSGTWHTHRYAEKVGRRLCIVWPDGRVEWSEKPHHQVEAEA